MKLSVTTILILISFQIACLGQPGLNKDTLHCLTTRQLNYYNTLPFVVKDLNENIFAKQKTIDTLGAAIKHLKLSGKAKDNELISKEQEIETTNALTDEVKQELKEEKKKNKRLTVGGTSIGSVLLGIITYLGIKIITK